MAISHDIYDLDISELATTIEIKNEQARILTNTLKGLQNDILDAVLTNEDVRLLVSRYGGYDVNEVRHEIDSASKNILNDIGFLLVLLIFSKISAASYDGIGFGTHFESIEAALLDIGWNEEDVKLLIRGRSFSDLLSAQNNINGEYMGAYWKYVKPSSTAAMMGWLSNSDVENFVLRLRSDKSDILASRHILPESTDKVTNLLDRVTQLFDKVCNGNHGICIIISG